MPIKEYVADHCLESLYCPKRFAFRQSMNDPLVETCPRCGTELSRILSSFSAGVDLAAHMAGLSDLPADSPAPPATLKNMFGGGLGDLGCGRHHLDSPADLGGCDRGCGADGNKEP